MLTQEQLQEVAYHIGKQTLTEMLIADIRSVFPGIHFTYCMDDDIPNHDAVFNGDGFNLYLVDGRDHCLRITNRFEQASGIVIAEVIED